MRRKLKSTPSDVLRVKFKELRARVKQIVSCYRAHFFQTLDADLYTNLKRFWSLFKLKTKDSTVPGNVSLASESDLAPVRSASCPRDTAEVFNDYFASVLNTDDDQTNSSTFSSTTLCEPTLSGLSLSPEDVLVCLRTLDVNKATGPDGISPRLLMETAHQIAPYYALYSIDPATVTSYLRNGNWLTSYQSLRKVIKLTLRITVLYHSSVSYRKCLSVAF